MAPLLSLRGIRFAHADGHLVLDGLDLEVEATTRLGLVGANGAGKTTLFHVMVGLRVPQSGEIVAFGEARRCEADFRDVRRRVGLLFQDSDDQLFCPTVLEDVAFGPLNLGQRPAAARQTALATLALLGLEGLAERVTHKLSGGQKRLVALATVLAMQPEVLLLDEPTNALDPATMERLIAILQGLPQALIVISHDATLLAAVTQTRLCLQNGRLLQVP